MFFLHYPDCCLQNSHKILSLGRAQELSGKLLQEHTQGKIICKRPMIFPRLREYQDIYPRGYPELEGPQDGDDDDDDEAQLLQKGLQSFRAAHQREGSRDLHSWSTFLHYWAHFVVLLPKLTLKAKAKPQTFFCAHAKVTE